MLEKFSDALIQIKPRGEQVARIEQPSFARFASFGGFKSAEARSAKAEGRDCATRQTPDFALLNPDYNLL